MTNASRSSTDPKNKAIEDYFKRQPEVIRNAEDNPAALGRLSEIIKWVDSNLRASGFRLSLEPIPAAHDNSAWQKRFGLTRAEARLAAHLLGGGTTASYAAKQGLSPHTVRNQLRAIYAKTNTNRQVSLLQLLLRATGKNP